MDRSSRQERHPNLCLRDPGFGQQECQQIPERVRCVQSEATESQEALDTTAIVAALCALSQSPKFRPTFCVDIGKTQT